MPDDVRFERLDPNDQDPFSRLYEIYRASLPERERKPEAELRRMLSEPEYHTLLAVREEVLGFAILFLPEADDFALLEYMAIKANSRNAGLGGRLFREAVQLAQPRALLLEVDTPDEQSGDYSIQQRRQSFYRREGCLRVDGLAYQLPLPGVGPPPAMDLFVRQQELRTIQKAVLARWLRVIYVRVYGRPADDPRIAEMLARLPDAIALV